MATNYTREVLEELQAVIKASKLKPKVTVDNLRPLAEVTEDLLVDVDLESVLVTLDKPGTGRDSYLRIMLVQVYIAADCTDDRLRIYDVADELESAVLKDNQLWDKVTDRDVVSITYDRAALYPKRGATILLEVKVRLSCD